MEVPFLAPSWSTGAADCGGSTLSFFNRAPWKGSSDDLTPTPQIIFSLCHTTARLPDGWRAAAQAWFDNCDHPEHVEHVLTWDAPTDDYENVRSFLSSSKVIFPNTKVGINTKRHTAVDGWNLAAKLSTGKFIISLADDWFPCPHWDTKLYELIAALPNGFDGEYVVDVDTCGNEHLLTFSMLTRAYLNKYSGGEGWLFYPEYTGMYADNDFTDSARLDKVIVNARHLKFPHRHPNYFQEVEPDDVHIWQGRPEAFRIGARIYKKRCKAKGLSVRPILAVCLPGEKFPSTWVAYLMNLAGFLSQRFTVSPIFTYSSNPHVTRACLAKQIIDSIPIPDYVLWVDDDNLLAVDQFDRLFQDLEEIPQADMVAGWAWVQPDIYEVEDIRVSVGVFGENGKPLPRWKYVDMMEGPADVREIDFSGFPTVLMRGEMLEKLGPFAFAPILDPKADYGFHSEDVSFCMHARQAGCRIFVDRRVRLPHLKLRDAQPKNPAGEPATDAAFVQPTWMDRRNQRAKELELAASK
jgi:hypothetical protein